MLSRCSIPQSVYRLNSLIQTHELASDIRIPTGILLWNKLTSRNNYAINKSRCVTTWSPLASAFNTRPGKSLQYSFGTEAAGLFNYKELREPLGFYLLKENAVVETQTLVNEALSPNRTRKMVQIFDDLSDTLCKVADLAEFVRIGHPERRFSDAAEHTSVSISSLVEELNTNTELYAALKKVTEEGDICSTDTIDDHVAKLFLFDFEQSGIHLGKSKRQRVVSLTDYILHVGSSFMSGTLRPRSVLKSLLSENIRNCFFSEGDSIEVTSLFADSDNELIREAAYRIYLHPDDHQKDLLSEMLSARYELSRLCGFETYAHRAVRGSMADTPDFVKSFLKSLSKEIKPRAQDDYNDMFAMKKESNKYATGVMPWDVPYYTALARHQRFKVESRDFCPYFSLGACMEGLNYLFKSLYGVSLEVQTIKPGEVWHSDVIKLAVFENSDLLGYIYCDFYERPNKANQDCHFTIQGGRLLKDGTYQLPIVVLMLNLPPPVWSTPSLLTPNMVDNLFHEMGHAMHSMLARTTYQHVTGTRCSTDLAEVPSVLMEYFASDHRVISQFARHYKTGEPIPPSLLESLDSSKNLFSASETQLQVFYAALDQVYHGRHPLEKSTVELLEDVQTEYYGLPYVQGTAWHLRFGHLVGYGAKYYAYVMSRAVASWIWHECFKDDPFSRSAGKKYHKEVLAYGGSKPPSALMHDFLGKQVTPEVLCQAVIKDIDEGRVM